MRHSLRLRVAALALMAGLATAPAAMAETLGDALVLAYRHSGLLEKNRAVLRAADEDVAQTLSLLRPVIDYTASVQRTWVFPNDSSVNSGFDPTTGSAITSRVGNDATTSTSIGITAGLLLWDGGATRLQIDAAKELVLVTRQQLIATEQQVLFNAVQAYLAVREALAFVELRQSNVRLIQEQLRASQDRFEVGEITRTEVAVAEAALASSRSNLALALGDLEQAKATYVRFIGQAPGTLSAVGRLPQIPPSVTEAQAIARRTSPDILSSMRLVTVADLNVARAEASIKPQIRANTSVNVRNDFEESASVGVTMSGPIYNGGRLTSLYRQAVANRDESRADLHITTDTTFEAIAQAYALFNVARARIDAGDLEVRAARLAFRSVQEEVLAGTRTTLDVLDAEQDLQDARANVISAGIAEVRAAYQILATSGLMTAEHLNLGIVTYDPSAYYNAVKEGPVTKVSPQGQKLDSLLRSLGKN